MGLRDLAGSFGSLVALGLIPRGGTMTLVVGRPWARSGQATGRPGEVFLEANDEMVTITDDDLGRVGGDALERLDLHQLLPLRALARSLLILGSLLAGVLCSQTCRR